MTSKILVDVMNDGSPCIRVDFGSLGGKNSDDLRDKVLRMFFERMGTPGMFVGVVHDNHTSSKLMLPMDIPHVLEWLHRYFCESLGDPDNIEKINDCFEGLREVLELRLVIDFDSNKKS